MSEDDRPTDAEVQAARETLGVDPDASWDTVKQAYRARAKELHPDVSDAPDAEEQFKRLREAFEILQQGPYREAQAGVENADPPGSGSARGTRSTGGAAGSGTSDASTTDQHEQPRDSTTDPGDGHGRRPEQRSFRYYFTRGRDRIIRQLTAGYERYLSEWVHHLLAVVIGIVRPVWRRLQTGSQGVRTVAGRVRSAVSLRAVRAALLRWLRIAGTVARRTFHGIHRDLRRTATGFPAWLGFLLWRAPLVVVFGCAAVVWVVLGGLKLGSTLSVVGWHRIVGVGLVIGTGGYIGVVRTVEGRLEPDDEGSRLPPPTITLRGVLAVPLLVWLGFVRPSDISLTGTIGMWVVYLGVVSGGGLLWFHVFRSRRTESSGFKQAVSEFSKHVNSTANAIVGYGMIHILAAIIISLIILVILPFIIVVLVIVAAILFILKASEVAKIDFGKALVLIISVILLVVGVIDGLFDFSNSCDVDVKETTHDSPPPANCEPKGPIEKLLENIGGLVEASIGSYLDYLDVIGSGLARVSGPVQVGISISEPVVNGVWTLAVFLGSVILVLTRPYVDATGRDRTVIPQRWVLLLPASWGILLSDPGAMGVGLSTLSVWQTLWGGAWAAAVGYSLWRFVSGVLRSQTLPELGGQ